jgi:methyl-galactoside transport system substrate-binding protein
MKNFERLLSVNILMFIIIAIIISCKQYESYRNIEEINILNPVKVSVLLYRFDDEYIAAVRQSLENIQAQNQDKVEFVFYDGMGNQAVQNQTLDKVLKEGTDLLLLNLVDVEVAQSVINKIKQTNIPVILFNREPNISETPIKSYSRALFIGTDAKEAGILQGKILINEWNRNRSNIDKNGDGILQYVMLMGDRDNLEAIGRTKYSILSLQEAGIKTEELALRVANWNKESAKSATEALLFRYGDRIEAIIANNDAMAIGAIEALQNSGYNKGKISRTIPVVGVDAIKEARDFIDKGYMTGTVLQDDYKMAEALYLVGMNLVSGRKPLEGTNYEFDETGVSIRIPYEEYIKSN